MTRPLVTDLECIAIAQDGDALAVSGVGADGRTLEIAFAFAAAEVLMMSLPHAVETALQRRHGDASARVVFPLARWRVERGPSGRLMLGVATPEGFVLHFSLTSEDARILAASLVRTAEPPGVAPSAH